MLRIKSLFTSAVLLAVFCGLQARGLQRTTTVPLPDDDPHKVAAPEQKPQDAPATAGATESGAAALPGSSWNQTTTISGVKLDFRGVASLKDVVIKQGPLPVSLNDITSSELVEGQQAVMQFRLTDAAGAPMSGLKMAAWLDIAQGDKLADSATCHKKIQSFLQMQLSARPDVDLNTYYVLALTKEPSILVIDPRVGFSTSKLYAAVDLAAPGADWVQSRNGERIFVTMPSVNQVAAVDANTFRLIRNIDLGSKPGRIVVQPDGKYAWLELESIEGKTTGGVTVIETSSLAIVARIPTGKGHHEFAFDEKQNVYVTNQEDGTVSIISTATLTKIKDLPTGKGPVAIAYSGRSKSMYVAAQEDGHITVLSTENHGIVATLAASPGLTALAISPDERWGFVANGKQDDVTLLELSSNKMMTKYKVGRSPYQLTFSTSFLYVRSRGTEQVRLIPLADIGNSAQTAEFPAGQIAPGVQADLLASPMVPSLDGDSAFVANPADKRVYYYQEGMAAPMMSIEGYGKTPVAVMVVDRSIHETEPGVYSVLLRLPRPGLYDVPVFVDSPALSHCFEFTVQVNPLLKKKAKLAVNLRPLTNNLQLKTGETAQVRFRLTDGETDKPRDGIKDVEVTILLAEGLRQMRFTAEPVGEGIYQLSFTPPQSGVYYGMIQIPSLKIRANQLQYLMIRAGEQQAAETQAEGAAGIQPVEKR
jgi:YVTN family beta-propeller protein